MLKIRGTPSKFVQIPRTHIFAANLTLYTKTNGEEKPEMHYLQRIGPNKAMTLDKATFVYLRENDEVFPCTIVHSNVPVKQAS